MSDKENFEENNRSLGVCSVSVVVPFHNAEQTIQQTIGTVYEALSASAMVREYEVVAVDDASTDRSREIISARFPEVRLFSLDKRGFYLESANKGLFHCTKEYVLLLTQGIFLPIHYFDSMLPHIIGDDSVYMCGAKLKTGTEQVSSRMLPYFIDGRVEARKDDENKGGATVMLRRGNILMRRESMLTLGGYNALFTAYSTAEFDLTLRGWSFGYKSLFIDDVECQIIEPSASSQDWEEKEEKGEEEWNEMLMHIFYDRGWRLFKYRFKMALFLSISILFPISLMRQTRWAYTRYLKNYNEVQNERTWRYGNMSRNLQEIENFYFK